ncbi:MAG: SDR family NAD(P)-dependent oxidoreductase [Candidatus Nitrosopolaris sp.]
MKRLEGKYALITGGSKGLGRQLAVDFVMEGAAGTSIVARHIEHLNEVKAKINEINPNTMVLVVAADLSRREDIERFTAMTLHEFKGRLDILVNNASTIGPSSRPFFNVRGL